METSPVLLLTVLQQSDLKLIWKPPEFPEEIHPIMIDLFTKVCLFSSVYCSQVLILS